MNLKVPTESLYRLIDNLDADKDGCVSVNEVIKGITETVRRIK